MGVMEWFSRLEVFCLKLKVKVGDSEKILRREEISHADIYRKSIPSRGKSWSRISMQTGSQHVPGTTKGLQTLEQKELKEDGEYKVRSGW